MSSDTDVTLVGAWHMKLRSKRGWVYLETKEIDGRVMEISPSLDRFVTHHQLKKIEPRPDDLLSYVARLKQVFDEAGRPLRYIQYITDILTVTADVDCVVHTAASR